MFDTKVAFIVRNDLAPWQRLNVVAFLATGLAAAHPEMIGLPYVDSAGHSYGSMAIQPMLAFEADLAGLQAAHKVGLERELTMLPYVHAMFSTGHDEANRAAVKAVPGDALDLVGFAMHEDRKDVDRVLKGLSLHP